jgi:hypothetical protein
MARELTYRVSLKADTSGARDVSSAFSSMDRHAGELSQSFVAVQGATRGSILGMANMVRQIGFLATAAKGLQAAMGWIGLALGILQAAWGIFSDKQKKAAAELKEATDAMSAAQKRLNDVMAAAKAPSYEPQIKALRDLADAYSMAESAAARLNDIQDKLAAAESGKRIAQIERLAAIEARDVEDPRERARIEFGAKREAAGIQYHADLDALDREMAAKRESLERLESIHQGLKYERGRDQRYPTPLKEAEAEKAAAERRLARAKKRVSTEEPPSAGGIEAWSAKYIWGRGKGKKANDVEDVNAVTRATEALAKAEERVARLQKDADTVQTERNRKIKEMGSQIEAARKEMEVFSDRREELGAKFTATEQSEWSAYLSADQKMRDAEAEKIRQQSVRAEAKRQEEAVTASAEQKQESIKQRTEAASAEYNQALNDEQRLRARILSPSTRRAQDREARSAEKEELRLEKSLERARSSRGRGKWKDDVEQYWSARITAAQKRDQLKQLEQDSMRAQVESKVELGKIRKFLEKNLQLAGPGRT